MSPDGIARGLAGAMAGAAVAGALAGAALWYAQQPRFDFRRITIEGELHHVRRPALQAVVADGGLAGTFFTLRLGRARAAFETIPWVASASVRRVWPDRLVVHITERRPIGIWSDGRVLSDAGVLFDGRPGEAERDGPLIEFAGPPQFAAAAVEKLHELGPALEGMGLRVGALDVSERASWTLRTTAGQTFELGRDDPPGSVAARLAAVAASYPIVLARLAGPPARVDARYHNGFAATRP